jgi:hypothetical protein
MTVNGKNLLYLFWLTQILTRVCAHPSTVHLSQRAKHPEQLVVITSAYVNHDSRAPEWVNNSFVLSEQEMFDQSTSTQNPTRRSCSLELLGFTSRTTDHKGNRTARALLDSDFNKLSGPGKKSYAWASVVSPPPPMTFSLCHWIFVVFFAISEKAGEQPET